MRVRVSQSCQITLEERSVTYSDVAAQAWYQDGVQFVSARGLFSGIGAGRFAPEGAMTRSMVASVLYRMEGAPECTEGPTFTDVPEGSWFAPGVQWAAQMGITSGTGGGRFAPEEPVTREALAAMLYRYAQQHGAGAMGTGSGTENFADRESISSWAGEAMEWAASNGILLGNGGEIRPGDLASRAEVAAMLMRFSAVIVDAQR
ncbi:S-layer homology domain-containing protein [Clostridium sp. J1101437_171009_A5]|nr:S-layer homology domain-containing protein [Clostridium sp. J1101437_171009_A5]